MFMAIYCSSLKGGMKRSSSCLLLDWLLQAHERQSMTVLETSFVIAAGTHCSSPYCTKDALPGILPTRSSGRNRVFLNKVQRVQIVARRYPLEIHALGVFSYYMI